MHEFCADVKLR